MSDFDELTPLELNAMRWIIVRDKITELNGHAHTLNEWQVFMDWLDRMGYLNE